MVNDVNMSKLFDCEDWYMQEATLIELISAFVALG